MIFVGYVEEDIHKIITLIYSHKQFDENNFNINDYNNNSDHCENCLFVLRLIEIILLGIVITSVVLVLAGFVYIGYMLCIYHRNNIFVNMTK